MPIPLEDIIYEIRYKPDQSGNKSGQVVTCKEWAYIAPEKTETGLQLGMYQGSYYRVSDQTEMVESLYL